MIVIFILKNIMTCVLWMRDWSSDVCSSDRVEGVIVRAEPGLELEGAGFERAAVEPLIGAPGRRPIGIVIGFPYPDLRVSLRLGRAVEVEIGIGPGWE